MKILVGIMHCIENEFEQCIASIRRQTHTDFEYFVIENLPNKEAHKKLYSTFMQNANTYDLFIKVDADMVLVRDTFFEEVVNKFTSSRVLIDDLEIAVHDSFTDRLIYGLHVYSNRMSWDLNSADKIFVDKVGKKGNYEVDFEQLAPAAYHCPDPSPFQAFHFGLHKAVKFLQIDAEKKSFNAACSHWVNLFLIYKTYLKNKTSIRLYALAGAVIALQHNFGFREVDYDSEVARQHFSAFDDQTNFQKKNFIAFNLMKRLFFLPPYISLEYNLFLSNNGSVPDVKHLLRFIKNKRGKGLIDKKLKAVEA